MHHFFIPTPQFLIRAGLAFAFIYAAIGAFIDPQAWIGFFPSILNDNIPTNVLLTVFGISELILAAWLLSGFKIRLAGASAALALFGIVAFNTSQMDIVFRDVSLALAALALARM